MPRDGKARIQDAQGNTTHIDGVPVKDESTPSIPSTPSTQSASPTEEASEKAAPSKIKKTDTKGRD